MKINRELVLKTLESVSAATAAKAVVEQSSCFVFQGGRVYAFNGEIAASAMCDIGVAGAVAASPFVAILQKLNEEFLDISVSGNELVVLGNKRRTTITMDSEVTLPIGVVEQPAEWKPLPEEFGEAVAVATKCASRDENHFALTCIHVAPNWVESCDNYQAIRYSIQTGVAAASHCRSESMKAVTGLNMTEIAETPAWLHFRNAGGVQLSLRRWLDPYPDIGFIFDCDGVPATLPGGLAEAVGRCEVFATSGRDDALVLVRFRMNEVSLIGKSETGSHEERKTVNYVGPPIQFMISPKLLADIGQRASDCIISQEKLKVDTPHFIYIACLGVVAK